MSDKNDIAEIQAWDPIGEAELMPGANGFTMAVFLASDVPVGTKLYATPAAALARAERAEAELAEIREMAAQFMSEAEDADEADGLALQAAQDFLAALSPAPTVTSKQQYKVGDFIGRQPVLCVHGSVDSNNLCPECEDPAPTVKGEG